MSKNLIQFAPIFVAAGVKINFDSKTLEATIQEVPKGKKTLVHDALSDIDKFIDTRTYNDGVAIYALADYFDSAPNPIHAEARESILEAVGLKRDGRFISQTLALLKSNKSWHISEEANKCTYFGEACTHRGIVEIAGKRGRKSTRQPSDYHKSKSNGVIDREQYVTSAVDALHRSISNEVVVSATKPKAVIRLEEIENLEPEELTLILEKIREVEEARNATV